MPMPLLTAASFKWSSISLGSQMLVLAIPPFARGLCPVSGACKTARVFTVSFFAFRFIFCFLDVLTLDVFHHVRHTYDTWRAVPSSFFNSVEFHMVTSGPLPRVVTVDEAAKILRLGRQSVYEAIHRKEIPAVRIGRRLVISLSALDRLLAGEEAQPHGG